MDFYYRFFIAFTIVVMSGCAIGIPKQSATKSDQLALWQQQKLNNSNISSWALKGKIGVKTGNKGGSATLKWSYVNDHQEIELYGPFGGGRIKISVTSDSAILKDTKGSVIKGETADQVLYQRLGWQVPFTELIMWCRGLPDGDATDVVIDQYGRLKSFNQGVWQVEYQEYRSVNDLILPRKLTVTSLPGGMALYDDHGKYIGDQLSVKVILKRWSAINQPDNLN
ncbi:lipoprotein insertase outer membrane protein LolB [Candidatus Spongiihabitans sp.]|uniref:lipoprotein insertase outer membrane protein LolB n=1 Tax=Candidatus Spongiihabitans sp. TaxID=3101308 RepID=UPI003C6FA1D1